jgi:fructan beta-fructosidase
MVLCAVAGRESETPVFVRGHVMTRTFSLLSLLVVAAVVPAADQPDILIADFEGSTYGDGWKTTGTAFGTGPAKGTLPNQMPVSGFLGKGLVNSFRGGDGSTGTLTSPEFKIERKYINFLVGGGKHPGKTCINLLVGGKVVRTATGPNDRPGGSEHLDWHSWDVAEFEGKKAVIQMIDDERGGWGHINVDHIVQSDAKKQAEPVQRLIAIDRTYLHLPVKNGAPARRMRFTIDGQTVREFDIELADGAEPDFWAFADVSAFKGKSLAVETVLTSGSKTLDTLRLADDVPDAEKLYREKHRPLFHFTSRRGWLNDPNGLVFVPDSDPNKNWFGTVGEWHLFYQHNPFGTKWGNMHWGHAVSPDLVRWKELGIGLYPRKYGDWAFSGSAIVDRGNTSGWGTKEKPPLVLAYTSTGRGECIAFSTDRGRTWTEYDKNPVVKHAGRDPKLVWYEPGKHWVMAVYDEFEGKRWIASHTSPDLKNWTFASRIEGFYECPDLFPMPVNGDPERTKWVLYGADGKYLTGDFDGKAFKPDAKEKKQLWYGRFYAAQTFENGPNTAVFRGFGLAFTGPPRRVQIGWAQGVTFPGMPFNQQMTVPVDLSLYSVGKELQLYAWPVAELAELREEKPAFEHEFNLNGPLTERMGLGDNLDAFDAELEIEIHEGKGVILDVRGTKITYDVTKESLTCKDVTAPLKLSGGVLPCRGVLPLRLLVDRGSVEVFTGFGEDSPIAVSVAALHDEKNRKLELSTIGGAVRVRTATVYHMKSAWEK